MQPKCPKCQSTDLTVYEDNTGVCNSCNQHIYHGNPRNRNFFTETEKRINKVTVLPLWNGRYDSACSCCYLGFGHSEAYHAENLTAK